MPLLALTPSDGMALTMVGILGFSLGTILTLLWVMARNAGRKPDIEDGLYDEEEEVGPSPAPHLPEPKSEQADRLQPWERDSDWWK